MAKSNESMKIVSSQIKELYPIFGLAVIIVGILSVCYIQIINPVSDYSWSKLSDKKVQARAGIKQMQSLVQQKAKLDEDTRTYTKAVDDEKKRMEALNLNRVYSTDYASYMRYMDIRAGELGVKLLDTKIEYENNYPVVTSIIEGSFKNIQEFFNKMNTQEIYLITQFDMKNVFSGVRVTYKAEFRPQGATAKPATTPVAGQTPKPTTTSTTKATPTPTPKPSTTK